MQVRKFKQRVILKSLRSLDLAAKNVAFEENKSFLFEGIKNSELERTEKENERVEMIDKLIKKSNKKGKDGENNDGLGFIERLQTKIMLITKHPEIKDPHKKMKSSKFKFKYTSMKDVITSAKNNEANPKDLTNWQRLWRESDSRPFDRRYRFRPQDDFNIQVQNNQEEDKDDNLDIEPKFESKNKLLQDKYDENFHSRIISTGTVSIVAEARKKQLINRTSLFLHHEYSSDESEISSDSPKALMRIQSLYPNIESNNDSTPNEESKFPNERVSSNNIKKLVSNAFSAKIKKNVSNRIITKTSLLNSSSSIKDRNNSSLMKSSPLKTTTEIKDKASKKKSVNKRLHRRASTIFEGKSKKRITNNSRRINPSRKSSGTVKNKFMNKRLKKGDIEQINQRMDWAIKIEKEPYSDYEESPDEFVDAKFDLNAAIIHSRQRDVKLKLVQSEWSGQDIIPAFEPYKTNIVINSLNSIRIYKEGYLRPFYKIREQLRSFVESAFFENIMTL